MVFIRQPVLPILCAIRFLLCPVFTNPLWPKCHHKNLPWTFHDRQKKEENSSQKFLWCFRRFAQSDQIRLIPFPPSLPLSTQISPLSIALFLTNFRLAAHWLAYPTRLLYTFRLTTPLPLFSFPPLQVRAVPFCELMFFMLFFDKKFRQIQIPKKYRKKGNNKKKKELSFG